MHRQFADYMKKILITCILAMLCIGQCLAQSRFVQPAFLKAGDSVAVVQVSNRIEDTQEEAKRLCGMMESQWGVKVRFGKHMMDTVGHWFPAPDAVRAEDVQEMLDDPGIRAIIFYRGGYGAARVIPYLDLTRLSRDPKWLVGFSDVTVMLYAALSSGVQCIHGVMPLDFGDQDFSFETLHDALFGKLYGYSTPPDPLDIHGEAEGPIVGGNLTLIASAVGTGVDFDYSQPYILFIEDVDEAIYATDRRMQNLKQSGRLDHCIGMIVGSFKRNSGEDEWGSSTYRLLHDYAAELGIPVMFGFPAGHIHVNCSLYLGRTARLSVTSSGGSIIWK